MVERLQPVHLEVTRNGGHYRILGDSAADDSWPYTKDGLFVGEALGWIPVLYGRLPAALPVTACKGLKEDFLGVQDVPHSYSRAGWEMVAERSLRCSRSQIAITAPDALHDLATFAIAEDWARVRLSVRGRRGANVRSTSQPVEQHLIELWGAARWEQPEVLLGPDEYGLSLLR